MNESFKVPPNETYRNQQNEAAVAAVIVSSFSSRLSAEVKGVQAVQEKRL